MGIGFKKIFSVTKTEDSSHKIINICGVKIKIKTSQQLSQKEHYCPICKNKNVFMPFGIVQRPNAQCPVCRGVERHRFLYYIYQKEFLEKKSPIKIMHTAPEKCISDLILNKKNIEYFPTDLHPENYTFINCTKEDVTDLTFADESFDFVLSNHVMEHILDEEKFLSELTRVLKKGAKLILTFPIDIKLKETFEDKNIQTDEDRLKFYGQEDHIRVYGLDIIEKLKTKYDAECVFAEKLLTKDIINKASIISSDIAFVITKK